MTSGVTLKHERIAAILAREIRSGRLGHGNRLPGEVELARRFGVSRNTVRSALAVLTADGLIATRTGKGSFVLFDGRPLDDPLGWTHALAEHGVETSVRVLRLELDEDPELAEQLELDSAEVIVVERIRSLVDGEAISLERSTLPAIEALRDLPERGLDDGSIISTLTNAGVHLAQGEQRLRARPLTPDEALLLGRPEDTWFLHSRRTSWTADNQFAEQVDSLLDPRHFELSLTYGETPR
ncbi:GntR family transcriptional regulator [Kribbella sp. NPDC051770]|uniref:GntR family transcriptional regulator n=1 Tax=Kribbella sp. NPDC051770 TaxID=3155413 RepID=UPI00341B8369